MTLAELSPATNSDDLFTLANAICACIDAPVTIEDRYSRVLAFSGRQEEADAMRIATVLGLRVPHDHVSGVEQRAVLRQLGSSRQVCFFDAASLGGGHVTLGRTAVAVRAGDLLLGFIWAAVSERLSPRLEEWLLRAADVVAVHLQQIAADSDRDRQRLSELVTLALGGGLESRAAMAALGLTPAATVVVAMDVRPPEGEAGDDQQARLMADTERLRTALGMHLAVMSHGAVVADVRGAVLALVPVRDEDGTDAVARTCRDFLARTDRTASAAIGVSAVAASTADLPRARAEAERALRVLRADAAPGGHRVARSSDVEIESLMLELRRLCEENGIEPNGAFARLRAYDARKGTDLLETLRAWLDTHGDTVTAAQLLHVHPNTFRYRLRRASEVGSVDLEQPHERFALNLQLRLFGDQSALSS
jgi:sugar diacid utilization regulator